MPKDPKDLLLEILDQNKKVMFCSRYHFTTCATEQDLKECCGCEARRFYEREKQIQKQ